MLRMKQLTLSAVALMISLVAGCSLAYHRSTSVDGFDFPSENVGKIVKGKTTDGDLMRLFGSPLGKSDAPNDVVEWRYHYSTGLNIEEQGFFTSDEHSTGHHKTLVILMKNGTVTDFFYSEGN